MNFIPAYHEELDKKSPFEAWFRCIKKFVTHFSKKVSNILTWDFTPFPDIKETKTWFQEWVIQSKKVIMWTALFVWSSLASPLPAIQNEAKTSQNFEAFFPDTNNTKFEDISPKKYTHKEWNKSISLKSLKWTKIPVWKNDFYTQTPVNFYDDSWKYIETFSSHTKIIPNISQNIFAVWKESYVFIQWHNHTLRKEQVLESWYIRTPWFDHLLGKETKETKTKPIPSYSYNSKKLFSGYLWPNGKEIPDYILKSVTINYFNKVIQPKIQWDLDKTEQEIAQTRVFIKKEVLIKKVNIKNSKIFEKQKEFLSKKNKLTKLSSAIKNAYEAKNDAILNPDIENIIQSLQSKPEWQKIICQASFIQKQKKKKNLFI